MSQQNLEYAELLEMAKKRNMVTKKHLESDAIVLKQHKGQKDGSKSFYNKSKKKRSRDKKLKYSIKYSKLSQDNDMKYSKESSLEPVSMRQKTPTLEDNFGIIDMES